jgi:hypothetical protein
MSEKKDKTEKPRVKGLLGFLLGLISTILVFGVLLMLGLSEIAGVFDLEDTFELLTIASIVGGIWALVILFVPYLRRNSWLRWDAIFLLGSIASTIYFLATL